MIKRYELTCINCDLTFKAEMEAMWDPNYCITCGCPIDLDDGFEDEMIEDDNDEYYSERYAD